MKRIITILMLLMITVLLSVSCKSAPKALIDEMDESRRMTQAARQRAIDFESPVYFPSNWESLEAQYQAAGVSDKPKKAEVEESIELYESLTNSYNELFKMTIPLYAQAREDEILNAREALILTGFTRQFPEYLKKADDMALEALDLFEKEDYYRARNTAAKALEEYEALLIGAEVFLVRGEINDRDFAKYDRENFSKADELAKTAIKEYEAGNKEAAIENAEEALLRYNLVRQNGWTTYTAERHTAASKERELAIAEKANTASRDLFNEAEGFYYLAQEHYNKENLHDAAGFYTEAEAMYVLSRQDTEGKRNRAQGLMQLANEKIEESSEAAMEAERIIEGGLR